MFFLLHKMIIPISPICSMYGIFIYIWVFYGVNVGSNNYYIHGAYGSMVYTHINEPISGALKELLSSQPRAARPPCSIRSSRITFRPYIQANQLQQCDDFVGFYSDLMGFKNVIPSLVGGDWNILIHGFCPIYSE